MKYPRTPYFDFSDSADKEDVRESGYFDLENFLNKELVTTIKLDGSNCLWTRNYIAARNGNHANGESFNYAKQLHAAVRDRIPEDIFIYGEWLWAKHSILYEKELALDGYFQVFGVYNTRDETWGSWEDIVNWSNILGVINVPAVRLIDPINNAKTLTDIITSIAKNVIVRGHEGIVVRNIGSFSNKGFNRNVAKFARANHVQTSRHWSKQKIVINKIRGA